MLADEFGSPISNATSTTQSAYDLSNKTVGTIQSMYAPVNVIAANNSNPAVKNAAAEFAKCTNDALALSTAAKRIAQRTICYADLEKAISTNLKNPAEALFVTDYNAKLYTDDTATTTGLKKAEQTKDRAGQLGTDSIIKILEQKLSINQLLLSSLQSQLITKKNLLSQQPHTQLKSFLTTLQNRFTPFTNARPALSQAQISQLNTDIASFNSQITALNTEIDAGKAEIADEANFERMQSDNIVVTRIIAGTVVVIAGVVSCYFWCPEGFVAGVVVTLRGILNSIFYRNSSFVI